MRKYLIVALFLLDWGVSIAQVTQVLADPVVDDKTVSTMIAYNSNQLFLFESRSTQDGSLLLSVKVPYPCSMNVEWFNFIVNGTALDKNHINVGLYMMVSYKDDAGTHFDKLIYRSDNTWKKVVDGKEQDIICPPEIQ